MLMITQERLKHAGRDSDVKSHVRRSTDDLISIAHLSPHICDNWWRVLLQSSSAQKSHFRHQHCLINISLLVLMSSHFTCKSNEILLSIIFSTNNWKNKKIYILNSLSFSNNKINLSINWFQIRFQSLFEMSFRSSFVMSWFCWFCKEVMFN